MMALNWKVLTPIAILMVSLTAVIEKLFETAAPLTHNVALLAVNILVIAVVVLISRKPLSSRRDQIETLADDNREMVRKLMGE